MNLKMKYIVALTNLYGQVSAEKVTEIYNLQNEKQLSISDIEYYLDEDLSRHFVYPYEGCFVHEAIMEYDEFELMLQQKSDKPYYIPRKEVLLKYSDMDYFERPKQYYSLYEYLKKNIFIGDDEYAESFCEDIALKCQNDFELNDIADLFNAYEINFKDVNQGNDVLQLIMDLANNIRLWENNGHTPDELSNKFERQSLRPLPDKHSASGFANVIDMKTRKKIGRNEPCPCGSGKKYKKCCIDKPIEDVLYESFEHYLDSFLTYEEVDAMGTDEIIKRLKGFGIPFRKDDFMKDIEKFCSAEEISENWFDTYKIIINGRDEDFPWFAAWVLWERLAKKGILPAEQISNLINKGYEYISVKDIGSACDVWLEAWEAIMHKMEPEFKSLDILEEQYKKHFFVKNLHQDLEMQLNNAGIRDKRYFEKRMEYCKKLYERFPNEDELTVFNMRRNIAETYSSLGDYQRAELEFEKLIRDYPDNPWGYIAWGDIYLFTRKDAPERAEELYKKALALAKDDTDIMVVQERLEDLEEQN